MSEQAAFTPEQRTPADELWIAVSAIESMAHARRGAPAHTPSEHIQLVHRNVYEHDITYALDYVRQGDRLYWPRLVIHNPTTRAIEWYEQQDEETVRCVPHSLQIALGSNGIAHMAEKLQTMQHMMQRGGPGISWKLRKVGK